MNNLIVVMPGSKSYTNRALIMAALTKGQVTLENPLFRGIGSAVTQYEFLVTRKEDED